MRAFAYGLVVGILLIPLAAIVVSLFGWVSVSATSNPPRWEASIARKAFAASVDRQAAKLQNPTSPTSVNLMAGLKFYRDGCAGCHGAAGKPSQWGTTGFYPRVPQFDSEPPLKPDWQMFWIVKHGVRYSGMGAWENLASDDDIWKVVTFLSHLKTLPPDVEAAWRGAAVTQLMRGHRGHTMADSPAATTPNSWCWKPLSSHYRSLPPG